MKFGESFNQKLHELKRLENASFGEIGWLKFFARIMHEKFYGHANKNIFFVILNPEQENICFRSLSKSLRRKLTSVFALKLLQKSFVFLSEKLIQSLSFLKIK